MTVNTIKVRVKKETVRGLVTFLCPLLDVILKGFHLMVLWLDLQYGLRELQRFGILLERATIRML